jgi:hypothetical protein
MVLFKESPMSEQVQNLLAAALKLSDVDRTELIDKLLEKDPARPEGLSVWDDDLEEELLARERDRSGSVFWEEL